MKLSLKTGTWPGSHAYLGEHFSTHHELGLSGKVVGSLVKNILEVIRNGGMETQHPGKVSSWFHRWDSRAEQHDHAEHHEDVPQGDEDSKVSEAQQEFPDVVTCAGLPRLFPKALRVLLFPTKRSRQCPLSMGHRGLSPLTPSSEGHEH